MNEHLSNFLKSIVDTESDIRWKDSGPDIDFFNICADKLNDLKVKTILDICCGTGDFVNICTKKYAMEAYGIDPIVTTKKNLYKGTIDSILKNQNLLNDFKFDCISIQNTLHGKRWLDEELMSIIEFLKKFSKYIVISDLINNTNIKLNGLTKIHSFDYSHGAKKVKNFFHRIYKVDQDIYKINNTINLDSHECFHNENTYPEFQKDLEKFKLHITELVDTKASATFYKFGDGDYRFLKKIEFGSAAPGKRAISKSYNEIDHLQFTNGAQLCDYYTCEIYPENRKMFSEVIDRDIDYPAEYGYGLVANKWFFQTFKGRIGILGASEKLNVIEELMNRKEYQDYLGLDSFTDYIHFPQKYAADDIDLVENFVGDQLKNSTADIFLLGIGHAKSGILHTFKKYKSAVYLDVGAGIDMIAGCISTTRPYAGNWKNFRLNNYDYSTIDYLKYNEQNEIYI